MENYMFTREFRRLHAGTIRFAGVRLRRAQNGLKREIVSAVPAGALRRIAESFLFQGRKNRGKRGIKPRPPQNLETGGGGIG